jgi:pimeloyl-ACP methyl ester carboxylesterase
MSADFLPPDVKLLTEPASIHMVRQIQRCIIDLVLPKRAVEQQVAIATAYVCAGRTSNLNLADRPDSELPASPILCLPGFDSSLLEFRYLLPLLASHTEAWAVDLLGFGFTTSDPEVAINPCTIRQHLYAVWKRLINQPVTLVGASLGGAIAIDLALAHPDCVRHLVLIDSIGFSGSFPLGQWLVSPVVDWAAEWLRVRKSAALTAAAAVPWLNPTWLDMIRCTLLHQAMPGWKESIVSFTQSGGYCYLSSRICQLQPPTLILWGDSDDVLGTNDARQFEQAIDCSQLVWIKSGHAPHLEQPQSVAKQIQAFSERMH